MKTTVYYSCSFVPPELIVACGCMPQRLAAACGNGRFSPKEGMCSYTKAWLAMLLEKSGNEDFTAVFTTSCDQMRRAFDLYCRQSGRKVFLLNVPVMNTSRALDYYQQELKRLRTFLCTAGESDFDEDCLRKLMLRLAFKDDPPGGRKGPQIALTGGPIPRSIRQAVQDILRASNGQIFFDASEDTLIHHFLKFDPGQTKQEPLKELAAGYFQLPAIWRRPNELFYKWFGGQIHERDIDGIILFRHVFCDLWHSQVYEFKRRFDMPVLEIDLDGGISLSVSAASRIQAFLEALAG